MKSLMHGFLWSSSALRSCKRWTVTCFQKQVLNDSNDMTTPKFCFVLTLSLSFLSLVVVMAIVVVILNVFLSVGDPCLSLPYDLNANSRRDIGTRSSLMFSSSSIHGAILLSFSLLFFRLSFCLPLSLQSN